jgi:hypothetical protein
MRESSKVFRPTGATRLQARLVKKGTKNAQSSAGGIANVQNIRSIIVTSKACQNSQTTEWNALAVESVRTAESSGDTSQACQKVKFTRQSAKFEWMKNRNVRPFYTRDPRYWEWMNIWAARYNFRKIGRELSAAAKYDGQNGMIWILRCNE